MSIQLADRSIKYPIEVYENLLVKANKFIFSVDFVILEMDKDELVLIILGWPFLATSWAVIDVYEGKETAKHAKICYDEDVHDLRSVETEFPAIVLNDSLTSKVALSCEPTVSLLNDNQIDFRISFDKSNDEDYMVIWHKNSFSYKIISVDNLKTDSKNDYDKFNMPSFTSPEPTVSSFDDLDFFKYFENEFLAIIYNDALTSKFDFLTKPAISPHRIDGFNLKDETSLSECEEEEQSVLYFDNIFSFNVIYPDDSKLDKDNVINTNVGASAQGQISF
nr:hypothetical protein [Tanacetum cinerariifolium]